MKEIHVQPGVVLVELKGTYMLVSDKEARKHCPYVRRVNDTGAFLWEQIKDGHSFDEILSGFMEKYEIDDSEMLKQDIHSCIEQLEKKGYLCYEGTGRQKF